MSTSVENETASPLDGRRVAFVGKLGGINRREARQLVRENGGVLSDMSDGNVDLVVIGADELPIGEEDLLNDATRDGAAEGRTEIISETQFWQRLGLVEGEQNVRRLYTPAMLADLLHVSVASIRRWHRRGLIVPAREVHRLPYFEFQEVATAQRLAQLLAAGASPQTIERQLEELSRYLPEVERPLAQLPVIVDGKEILLRQGEGLIEPSGQMRIDFEAIEADSDVKHSASLAPWQEILPIEDVLRVQCESLPTPAEMLDLAVSCEDQGDLESAADMYRAVLSAAGPKAEICFQLAEVLYRLDDVTGARERYYMAIELDEDYVEARANLGCVLAETGQMELAVAAFEGALEYHSGYPDVHYHLARTLDELNETQQAEQHWHDFLELAPSSPWADEARARLGLI